MDKPEGSERMKKTSKAGTRLTELTSGVVRMTADWWPFEDEFGKESYWEGNSGDPLLSFCIHHNYIN